MNLTKPKIEITGLDGIQYAVSEMFSILNYHDATMLEKLFEDQRIRITFNTWWVEWVDINFLVTITRRPISISIKYHESTPKMYSNTDSKKFEKLLLDNINYYLKNHWNTEVYNKTGVMVEHLIFNLKELQGEIPRVKPRPVLAPIEVPMPTNPVKRLGMSANTQKKESPNDNPSFIPPPVNNAWQNETHLFSEEERKQVFFLETLKDSRRSVKDLDQILVNHGKNAIKRWLNEVPPDTYGVYNWYGSSLHLATTLEKWETLDAGGKQRWIPNEERPFRIEQQIEKLLWISPYIETWKENYYGMDPISHVKVCKAPTCFLFTSDDFIPILDNIHDSVMSKTQDYDEDNSQ